MNYWVHYSCDSEDASDYSTDIDQELEDIFLGVGVMHCDWSNLVVEKDNVFWVLIVSFIRRIYLEGFSCENISNTVISFKLRWHGVEKEADSHF